MSTDSATSRPPELPVHLTRFIGRGRELEELEELLGQVRIVTLTGAGGSGKTRLAGEVAARAAGFDRVAWADLAPVGERGLLAPKIAAAVRAPERPDAPPLAWIVDAVGGDRVLLVLDNCEHLVEDCALVVDTLLRSCPGLTVLATSREALGVSSETAWLVPPLGGHDAVQLFVERARAALPSFSLGQESAGAVSEICRRLDGIPLAIELAAARVRVLSPAQIADRLDDAFRLLNTGSRTALPRHRTLRATMEWSFDLLDEAQQILLSRLAVFTGSFTLEAAEAVCSEDPLRRDDILDGISVLADKSLLILETDGIVARYHLLETVRQYGIERLTARGETARCRDRHADYFLATIEAAEPKLVGGAAGPGLVQELGRDQDNLRAATTWCLADAGRPERALRFVGACYWFWYAFGHFREARRFVDQALALEGPAAPATRGRALVAGALTALAQGDYPVACRDFEKGLALLADGGAPFDVAAARGKLAAARLLSGDLEAAVGMLDALLDDVSDWPAENMAVVSARFWRGWAAYVLGDVDRAGALLEENVRVGRAHHFPTTLANALGLLARIAFARGDTERAAALASGGLHQAMAAADGWGLAFALDVAAAVAAQRGDAEAGARLLGGVAGHRQRLAIALPGIEPAELATLDDRLRRGLGARFDALVAEGRALATDEVVALGRAALDAVALDAVAGDESAVDARHVRPSGDAWGGDVRIRVSALGPLRVEVDGALVEPGAWGSARPRELLLYLLMHPDGRTKEQVGLAFWPDASPAQLRNNFHVTLHRLRKALRDDGVVGFAGDRYRVDAGAVEAFDVTGFERDTEAARRALRRLEEGAAARLEAALAVYRGDFLDGEPMGDWHLEHRDRLRRTFVDGLATLARHQASEGRHARAVEACRRLLAHDPLEEGAVRTLMESCAALGDRTEALRAYQRFADRLRDELGMEPARETTRLYQTLQKGAVATA